MTVSLMGALDWLSYGTAGVAVTAIAVWLLLRLFPVRSLGIQRFAWLLVLLPGVAMWRISIVLPIMPTGLWSGVDMWGGPEREPLSEAGARSLSIRGPGDARGFATRFGNRSGVLACAAVLSGWMVGMIALAAHSAWSYVAFATRLPRSLPATDEWMAELREVCAELGIQQIPLHVTQRFGPALCLTGRGYFLLVPQDIWGRFSTQQRRSILRHELAHYLRGDLWKSLLARILAWPQWFNPLAWLAVRQFEEAAECACDDVVVMAEPEDAFDYLRALLEVGTYDSSTFTQLQASVNGGSLQRRVRRLLSPAAEDSLVKKIMVVAAALFFMAGGFARVRLASAYGSGPKTKSVDREQDPQPEVPPVISLIANGGFEEPEVSGDPNAWFGTRLPRTAGNYVLALSSSPAHGGQRSAVVEIGNHHPDPPVHYNWTTTAKGWQVGQTYELSGWIKVENARHSAFLLAQCRTNEGKQILGGATTQLNTPVTGTTDWTRVSVRFRVPEGTGVVRIRAGLSSCENPGAKAWFDDVSLVAAAN